MLLAVLNETEWSCVNTELYQRQYTTTMVGQCLLTAGLMTCVSVKMNLHCHLLRISYDVIVVDSRTDHEDEVSLKGNFSTVISVLCGD